MEIYRKWQQVNAVALCKDMVFLAPQVGICYTGTIIFLSKGGKDMAIFAGVIAIVVVAVVVVVAAVSAIVAGVKDTLDDDA